jgi:CheY-like chemotaxis protein
MTSTRRFLLVEDEYLIAALIEEYLADLEHRVVAVAATLGEALEQAHQGSFDAALLDLQLGGASSYSVADILSSRGIPLAFVTGRAEGDVPAAYGAVPVLCKPFRFGDFAAIIARLLPPDG